MSADNTRFDMTAVSLKPALEIAFANAPGRKAWGFKSTPTRLTFAWHEAAGKEFHPFVVPIDAEMAIDVVRGWLAQTASYGAQPDHDGDNEKSFRIFCEDWGNVDHNQYAFVAIEPRWAVYGK